MLGIDLNMDTVEFFDDAPDAEGSEISQATIPRSGVIRYPLESLSLPEFLPKIFSQRIEVDIFDAAMGEMLMSSFGNAFGLPDRDPVSGFVAGAFEAVFPHKGLK